MYKSPQILYMHGCGYFYYHCVMGIKVQYSLYSDHESGTTSCPGSPVALTNGDRFRVEDEQFRASSSYSDEFLPYHARITSDSWCSAEVQQPHWIEVDFGTNVIIHEIQIGGHDGFFISNSYLTMFQVQFGQDSGQLTSIVEDNTSVPIIFSRTNGHNVETTTLPTPIVTQILRISPVDWTQSVPCVRLDAIGCLQMPGMEVYIHIKR